MLVLSFTCGAHCGICFRNYLLHLFPTNHVPNPVSYIPTSAKHCLYLPAYFLASTWLIVLCVNDVTIHVRQSESSNKLTHTPPRTPPKFRQKRLKPHPLDPQQALQKMEPDGRSGRAATGLPFDKTSLYFVPHTHTHTHTHTHCDIWTHDSGHISSCMSPIYDQSLHLWKWTGNVMLLEGHTAGHEAEKLSAFKE